jgi:hypothetical protein
VTGLDGVAFYDETPKFCIVSMKRQLLVGIPPERREVLRFKKLLFGQLTLWFDQSVVALESIKPSLSVENQGVFVKFQQFRKSNFFNRLSNLLNLYFLSPNLIWKS